MKRTKLPGTDDATDAVNDVLSNGINHTWLHGNYPSIDTQIDIHVPYVFIENMVWQDDAALQVMDKLLEIKGVHELTVEEAVVIYKSRYLNTEDQPSDNCTF